MGKEQSRGFLLKETRLEVIACVCVCVTLITLQAFLMPGIVLEVVTVVGRVSEIDSGQRFASGGFTGEGFWGCGRQHWAQVKIKLLCIGLKGRSLFQRVLELEAPLAVQSKG